MSRNCNQLNNPAAANVSARLLPKTYPPCSYLNQKSCAALPQSLTAFTTPYSRYGGAVIICRRMTVAAP